MFNKAKAVSDDSSIPRKLTGSADKLTERLKKIKETLEEKAKKWMEFELLSSTGAGNYYPLQCSSLSTIVRSYLTFFSYLG